LCDCSGDETASVTLFAFDQAAIPFSQNLPGVPGRRGNREVTFQRLFDI
jgi:hypothetical protein